jgi:salicylate hydroxylase
MPEQNIIKSSKAVEKVAIIGAGLGGLAVAIALRKKGIDAQVYEKAKELQPVGAGLTLLPNGLSSLDAIAPGIVKSLKASGSQTHTVNLKKNTGEMIVKNNLQLQEKYGQPMLNIRWSRLQEILASHLPPDSIKLNHKYVDFEQDANGVQIYFDGGKTATADLLIGADGINSAVRQTLIGDGLPRYSGRISWRAVIKYEHELLSKDESTFIIGTDGKNFNPIDVGGGYLYWVAVSLYTIEDLQQTAVEVKSRVLQAFDGWAEPIQAIIKATAPDEILERPIYDRPPLKAWSEGRVTLLGDAAHPMVPVLGQGANTAFEDAWELAEYLAHASIIKTALASYENSRINRTQVIQARSAFQGNRSYDADNDEFLGTAMQQAQLSQVEFDDWLYNYKPSICVVNQ